MNDIHIVKWPVLFLIRGYCGFVYYIFSDFNVNKHIRIHIKILDFCFDLSFLEDIKND